MTESICGVFDCSQCEAEEACGGCRASCGRPFGGQCIAAETIKAGGREAYDRLQKELTEAFNALGIPVAEGGRAEPLKRQLRQPLLSPPQRPDVCSF